MSKKLVIGAVVGAAVVAGLVSAAKSQSEPKPSMWEKMRDAMDEMPEDFPPRVMFENIEAIKANTDEMLALLRQQGATGE